MKFFAFFAFGEDNKKVKKGKSCLKGGILKKMQKVQKKGIICAVL